MSAIGSGGLVQVRARRPLAVAATVTLVLSAAGCGGAEDRDGAAAPPPGTPDAGAASASPSWIPGHVARMTLAEKVGQLFVPTFSGRADAIAKIRRYHVGGLVHFPANMTTPARTAAQSNALQKASRIPLLLDIDEEQGIVTRTPFLTRFPGNMALGAAHRPDEVRAALRATGAELRAIGLNHDYAPVADVNVNPRNPVIGLRSFGSDPARVSALLTAAIAGLHDAGIAATAKHFPGHGDTATDSHTGLPVITHSRADWERLDAPPFKAAIAAGVDTIMTAHIVVPKLDGSGDPSTLSRTVLTGLLRERLGFQGVIITDSLQMAGVRKKYSDAVVPVRAINAGADQLLMPPSLPKAHRAVLAAVRSGVIPQQRLDDAVTRILVLKERRGLFRGTAVDPSKAAAAIGTPAHRATARQVAEHSVTLVRNQGKTLPLKGRKVSVTGSQSTALAAALRRQGVRVTPRAQADVHVLATFNAGAATAARIRSLGPKPVVVAALSRPYDLNSAGRAAAALATYSSSALSVTALAKVLAGTVNPAGRLPVPAGGRPVGHGLRY